MCSCLFSSRDALLSICCILYWLSPWQLRKPKLMRWKRSVIASVQKLRWASLAGDLCQSSKTRSKTGNGLSVEKRKEGQLSVFLNVLHTQYWEKWMFFLIIKKLFAKIAPSILSSRSNAHLLQTNFQFCLLFSILMYKCQAARKAVNDGSMSSAAGGVASVGRVQLKLRKTLKGHLAKIYAMHWSADSR